MVGFDPKFFREPLLWVALGWLGPQEQNVGTSSSVVVNASASSFAVAAASASAGASDASPASAVVVGVAEAAE